MQQREKARGDEVGDGGGGELPEVGGVEGDAGGLPLAPPEVAVGVEDAVAEEIPEHVPEVVAFGEATEPGLEQVLHVPRVCRHHAVQICKPVGNN